MKWVGIGLVAGVLLWAIWHGPIAHGVAWGLFSVALMLVAQGVRRWRGAIPDGKGNWIAYADAPAEFRGRRRRALWGLYASSTISTAIAMLPLLSSD